MPADKTADKAAYGKGRAALVRAEKAGNVTALGKLVDVLEGQGVDLADLGNVKALWHKTKVDDETGAEVYAGSSVLLAPSWETGPKWTPVDRGAPVRVTVPKPPKRVGLVGTWRTAVVLPDPQVGYRRLTDGTLDPFHDERAISVARQVLEAERPDLTVWLGDYLDLAPMGKYRYEPSFALTVQPALDYGHELLAVTRELSGEVRLIEGNHDLRLSTYLIDNAAAAYGLKRGGAKPDDWPVMSVPYLLRLDELGVEYVGGYPNGATYINDNLACIHGVKLDLVALANDEAVSVIQGHMHRIGSAYKTRNSRGAPKFSAAFSPGCLCRIDGAVPSTKSSLDPHGRPAKSWENWAQGLMVVRYQEGDGRFSTETVPIFEGEAVHRQQLFTAA